MTAKEQDPDAVKQMIALFTTTELSLSTQAPTYEQQRELDKSIAFGTGWKLAYYSPDKIKSPCPFTETLEVWWFKEGIIAGFEALVELDPDEAKKYKNEYTLYKFRKVGPTS